MVDLKKILHDEIYPRLTVNDIYGSIHFNRNQGRYLRAICPLHQGADNPSAFCVDTETLNYKCYTHCGHGDPLQFICGGKTPRGQEFIDKVHYLAQLAGVELPDKKTSPMENQHRVSNHKTEYNRPPQKEVHELWQTCHVLATLPDNLTKSKDYLAFRKFPVHELSQLDLVRCVPLNHDFPKWYPASWAKYWSLAIQAYEPSGKFVSLHFRAISDDLNLLNGTKTRWPYGYSVKRLFFANEQGVKLLQGKLPETIQWVYVAEGMTDFLTLSLWVDHNKNGAVFGGVQGSFQGLTDIQWPSNLKGIVILTDYDEQGKKYAKQIKEALPKIPCYRPQLPESMDITEFLSGNNKNRECFEHLIDQAQEYTLTDSKQKSFKLIRESLPDAIRCITNRHLKEETPIKTPWSELNDAMDGGLWGGQYVVVGNTGSGKTQFHLQIAHHAALQGIPTAYVALEGNELEFVCRILGLETGEPWSNYYLGKKIPPQLNNNSVFKQGFFYLKLGNSFKTAAHEIRECVEFMKTEHQVFFTSQKKPFLLIIDFLQLMGSNQKYADVRTRIAEVAYQCNEISREYNAVIFQISSTARENYDRFDGKVPKKRNGEDCEEFRLGVVHPGSFIGTGKESGEIEYSAYSVLVLARDKYHPIIKNEKSITPVYLGIAKKRTKSIHDWIRMTFNGNRHEIDPTFVEEKKEVIFSSTEDTSSNGQRANEIISSPIIKDTTSSSTKRWNGWDHDNRS